MRTTPFIEVEHCKRDKSSRDDSKLFFVHFSTQLSLYDKIVYKYDERYLHLKKIRVELINNEQ